MTQLITTWIICLVMILLAGLVVFVGMREIVEMSSPTADYHYVETYNPQQTITQQQLNKATDIIIK